MSLIFFGTDQRERLVTFYTDRVGMEPWLEQPSISILKHENLLIGFSERTEAETCGVTTFVYDTEAEVDEMYQRLEDIADEEPSRNDEYRVYQFFASDPEGRTIEFQSFLHPTDPV